ncbi:hypothetical protein ACFR9U_12075 [Halorientalis brevis]|uniref:Uncharacterized protein n=1 Tax=Halorientalis brevis TaxID=1126241 RepID=A0ABD6CE85_9EURY|nr:hypothetical protein [Halorientalis brevis]
MSDPGPTPDAELEQLRTELQHAREDAGGDVSEVLDNLTEALGNLDASDDEPRQDHLESIRAELARLEDDTEGDTRKSLDRAREHVRAILEARLTEDESVSDRMDDQD